MEGDPFEVADIDLPPYKVLVDGEEVPYSLKDEYLAGNYPTEMYVDHYMNYFGPQKPVVEFIFENSTDRNLLIFGSSYVRPIQTLLASHYHHTYVVFLKSYPDFSLSEFLAHHPVQDVLVVGDQNEIYRSKLWMIKP